MYLGFVVALIGLVTLVRPLHWLRIGSRRRAALVLGTGAMISVAGFALPARESRITMPVTGLDDVVPAYQFNEIHSRHIDASPEVVYDAMKRVTASEIRFFRTLTWIRRFGRAGPENILNAPEELPILDVAIRTTFLPLLDRPSSEIVLGTLVHRPRGARRDDVSDAKAFAALQKPGYAKAAMNFRIEPVAGGGTLLSTETRVYATDATARKRFARYWRVIYPGSALIRRGWLRAIERRAES